jgi:hypothetical protein
VEGPIDEGFDFVTEQVSAGSVALVVHGDVDLALAGRLLEGTPIGMAFDLGTGAPRHLLTVPEAGMPPRVELAWHAAPPFFYPNAAMALSAHHGVLILASGTDNGLATGDANAAGAMLNLETGTWSNVGDGLEVVGHALGATYSQVDEAMWFVNLDDEGTVRIGRWTLLVPSTPTAEVRWALPPSWGSVADAHLVATSEGNLVIAFQLATGGTRVALFTDLLTVPVYAGAMDIEMTVRRSPLPIAGGVLLAGDGASAPTMEPLTFAAILEAGAPPLEDL